MGEKGDTGIPRTAPAHPFSDGWVWLVLGLCTVILYITAPKGGAFYWSDAPRHALNGVFIKDLLAAFPWRDPAEFAYQYYAQYPALTILFYPPLFYAISAPFFAMLGVSHEVALLVEMLHYVAFGLGCYSLARLWLDRTLATCFACTMMFVPEIAFWGRQVMLEVPAYAFMVWSAVYFARHLRSGLWLHLSLSAALLILAMYTKISVGFVGLVYGVTLLVVSGFFVLRQKVLWAILVASVAALVPLLVLTMKFGQANIQSVSGIADRVASRTTLDGWLWYARQWPDQLGWALTLAIASSSVVWLVVRRGHQVASRAEIWFLLLWFAAGYFYFSAIDLKEARHSVYILLPPVLVMFLVLGTLPPRMAKEIVALSVTVSTAATTLAQRPVYFVDGYASVVAKVAELAPRNSVVLFSGYRDGSFTFNMRAREDRRDLSVLRADKLLLNVAVRRELGVEQKQISQSALADLINRYGVHYLVVQPGFWNDLEVMKRFEDVLKTPQFREVARISTPANFRAHEQELVIYRNFGDVATGPIDLRIDLPIIGRSVEGQVGREGIK